MKIYKTDQIRNLGLFGHVGSGKTSLAEAMLFNSKAINRLGKVEEGSTVTDYDPDEIKRTMSIVVGLAPVEWEGSKINVIDAPGYPDFVGETKAAMRVADAALIVLDASGGVEVGSESAWSYAEECNISRAIFVNKMERENANFAESIRQAQEKFGSSVVALTIPIGSESTFKGIIDLLQLKAFVFSGKKDGSFEEQDVPADQSADVTLYREQLIEKIAESDDELLMKYLDGEELGQDELEAALSLGVKKCAITPVLCGSGAGNIGIQQLMSRIIHTMPSPADLEPVVAKTPSGGEKTLTADPAGPLAVFVFKTQADPYVGKLSYFRVYSGTFKSDAQVLNANKGKEERIGTLYFARGKEQQPTGEVPAGDIGAVTKLGETSTGDTLCSPANPVILPHTTIPEPSFTAAIHPKTKADLDKLGQALVRIAEEDPTIHISKDPQTGESLMSGMGESHVQITTERMHRKFGTDVEIALPIVPYRETIQKKVQSEYKHKKQTGGHGQYGHVYIEIEPVPDIDFEFTERVVGGSVPRNYIPAVEKGVREAIVDGILAGYPVVHVRVTLYDGSFHPVDSSEMAFKLAASQAFRKGAQTANPTILEPIMNVEVTVPDSFTGDVMSDLNGKRARVMGMDPQGNGTTKIQAQAPLAEFRRYTTDLRSITQGRGTFHMDFDHYEEVPPNLIPAIVEEAKKLKEAESK